MTEHFLEPQMLTSPDTLITRQIQRAGSMESLRYFQDFSESDATLYPAFEEVAILRSG